MTGRPNEEGREETAARKHVAASCDSLGIPKLGGGCGTRGQPTLPRLRSGAARTVLAETPPLLDPLGAFQVGGFFPAFLVAPSRTRASKETPTWNGPSERQHDGVG